MNGHNAYSSKRIFVAVVRVLADRPDENSIKPGTLGSLVTAHFETYPVVNKPRIIQAMSEFNLGDYYIVGSVKYGFFIPTSKRSAALLAVERLDQPLVGLPSGTEIHYPPNYGNIVPSCRKPPQIAIPDWDQRVLPNFNDSLIPLTGRKQLDAVRHFTKSFEQDYLYSLCSPGLLLPSEIVKGKFVFIPVRCDHDTICETSKNEFYCQECGVTFEKPFVFTSLGADPNTAKNKNSS